MNERRVFLFDLDGTLTQEELLPLIGRELGIEDEIRELTATTMNGDLDFEQSLRKRVGLLAHVPGATVAEIVTRVPLFSHLLQWILARREDCWIVTGNLDCWVGPLLDDLGLQYFASSAELSPDGTRLNSVLKKEEVVRRFCDCKTVVVGDGANDAQAMAEASHGVATAIVHTVPSVVIEVADFVVSNEETLCYTLSQLSSVPQA